MLAYVRKGGQGFENIDILEYICEKNITASKCEERLKEYHSKDLFRICFPSNNKLTYM